MCLLEGADSFLCVHYVIFGCYMGQYISPSSSFTHGQHWSHKHTVVYYLTQLCIHYISAHLQNQCNMTSTYTSHKTVSIPFILRTCVFLFLVCSHLGGWGLHQRDSGVCLPARLRPGLGTGTLWLCSQPGSR